MSGGFRDKVEAVTSVPRLMKLAVRELRRLLEAQSWVWASFDRATGEARDVESSSSGGSARAAEIGAALERRVSAPTVLSLALQAEARTVQVLVFRRDRAFTGKETQAARAVLQVVDDELDRRHRQRRRDLVERSYAQLLRRLRGNDLHYRILHAIRDLVDYDHSAAVCVAEPGGELFRLQAEQVAWTKGRSSMIGRPFDLGEFGDLLRSAANRTLLFRREPGGPWCNLPDAEDPEVAIPEPMLDFHRSDPHRPQPHSALVAPLVFEAQTVGVLAAYGKHPLSLSARDVDTLRPFVPLAAIAVHNQRRDEDLERAFLEQQKRHAVPDIARGVAHDVNNALGSLLLRARALREDLEDSAAADAELHAEDVRMIERSASHCRRIFQGLLQLARRGMADVGDVHLEECVRHVMQIEGRLLEARGVRVDLRIEEDLPPVRGVPQQMEQLVFNLLQNARQASKAGDRVLVSVRRRGDELRLGVANEVVIPRHLQARVFEPFFTTRSSSHGLGLALCRAIVVDHGGQLRLRSREGRGTWLQVRLPVAPHEQKEVTS